MLRDLNDDEIKAILQAHGVFLGDHRAAGGARADFTRANLSGKDMSGQNLEGAVFKEAHLQETKFGGTTLSSAKFVGCNGALADFTKLTMKGADFSNARLQRAIFTGASTDETKFERARLDYSVGLVLDGNRTAGASFRGADEPWNRHKRRFSGSRLVFNLVLFVAFFLPYFGRALGLLIASELYTRAADLPLQGLALGAEPPTAEVREVRLLWVLIGGEQDHWLLGSCGWVLSLVLIAAALSRAGATYWTISLVESEAETGYAPRRSDTRWLLHLGGVAEALKLLSWAAFAINVVQWWLLMVPIAE